MNVVLFYHSVISDWNNGHAHFLRGVASELQARGHEVHIFEPYDAWSVSNLLENHGPAPICAFHRTYPHLRYTRYDLDSLNLKTLLDDVDLVIAHEWNDHALIDRLNTHRADHEHYRLLFHDTHHRAVTHPEEIEAYELDHFDGVLAFGRAIRRRYLDANWAQSAWTWHEAADTNIFHPLNGRPKEGDVVWIGNWGDEERTDELREFFIEPVNELGLTARAYGVRYPDWAQRELADAGIEYAGWLPNCRVPDVFARFEVTVHIPRRPYAEALPGIPTVRPFEALACGIPLVCSPWEDAENLFTPGSDYLVAHDGDDMKRHLRTLLEHPVQAQALAHHGRRTIGQRHTCVHRVDELMTIVEELERPKVPSRVL